MSKQLRIDHIDPADLTPNAWNTNVVSPDNEKKLEESIRRFGLYKPILVRTLQDGTLEVLGGEHRWHAAIRAKMDSVPVLNLGKIDDKTAKEISLTDNARYGIDDTLQLAQLLETLGSPEEIASFMPYNDADLETIFASVSIAVDDLEITPEEEQAKPSPAARKVQEFQLMQFKVPVADAALVQDAINAIMKTQGFTKNDSLTNAGMALVHLCESKS